MHSDSRLSFVKHELQTASHIFIHYTLKTPHLSMSCFCHAEMSETQKSHCK